MKTVYLALFAAFALAASVTIAQTDTTFTYQGQLLENGSPANGSFNMEFSLWDAAGGGSQVGTINVHNGVQVTEGGFAVNLDFGANAFDNSNRWLEIEVSGIALSPRNPVTRVPYAIQTRGIFVDQDNRMGIGTTAPLSDVHVAGNQAEIRLQDDDNAAGYALFRDTLPTQLELQKFSPNNVLFDLDGLPQDGTSDCLFRFFRHTNTTGVKRAQFYRGDGTTARSAGIGVDGADSWFQLDGGNFGIGTSSPDHKLDVQTNGIQAAISGYSLTLGAGVGVEGTTDSNIGRGVVGTATSTGSGWGVVGRSHGNFGVGVLGESLSATGPSRGVEGRTDSDQGTGVYGFADAATGGNNGVFGGSDSVEGRGVYGRTFSISGDTIGVQGQSASFDGTGVYGTVTAGFGDTHGVRGHSSSSDGTGVFGFASDNTGENYGVQGRSMSANGYDFYASGAGLNYGASSSRRWKNKIEAIDQPLEKISSLRGVYFDWDTEHGGHHDIGMIAEEVGKVLPEIVQFEENGVDAQAMDYSLMTPLLVEAVKSLDANHQSQSGRIAQLEQENEALRTRDKLLHARLDSLEQLILRITTNEQE